MTTPCPTCGTHPPKRGQFATLVRSLRVATDPTMAPGTAELRDPKTGRVVVTFTNVGAAAPETEGKAP